jgi:hypothetical protein
MGYWAPQKINFRLYTSDTPEYKGAFVLCDVTCRQAKIDFLWWGNLVDWQAQILMVITTFQSSKYETWFWEENNKSMDVQHIWETQYVFSFFFKYWNE